MIKLSKEILYIGIVILVLSQLSHYFTRFAGPNLIITSSLQIANILFFAFELMLLNSILIEIQQNKSFTVWLIIQFVLHVVSSLLTVYILTFSRDLFIEHVHLFSTFPRVVMVLLQIVLAIKFFLLKGRLSLWFKIYTVSFLLQIVGLSLGIQIFESYGDAMEVYYNVTWGLSFLVSLSLALLFFQATQELDRASAPEISDDILDLS